MWRNAKKVSYSMAQRAILRLFIESNSLTGEIFLPSDWEFFGEIGKKEDILGWEWGLISDPGDREKRPWSQFNLLRFLFLFYRLYL